MRVYVVQNQDDIFILLVMYVCLIYSYQCNVPLHKSLSSSMGEQFWGVLWIHLNNFLFLVQWTGAFSHATCEEY